MEYSESFVVWWPDVPTMQLISGVQFSGLTPAVSVLSTLETVALPL